MANQAKITKKRLAVLTYDGRGWSAFCFDRHEVAQFKEAGLAASIPAGVLNFLREHRNKTVRILLEGEVRRLETSLPPKLSFNEASALMAHEVAEQSGADGVDLVCAGGYGSLVGSLEPFLLCGALERQRVDGLHQQLTLAGLQFDGVGPLELACAAFWNAHRNRDTETLILLGGDHGFVLPARNLPDQPGPLPLSGGLRQVDRDPEAWQTRFIRGNRYLMKGESLSVYALGGETLAVAPLLGSVEELPKPDYPEIDTLLEGAARQAALGQANQFSAPVPIRNPHVLRKRFGYETIVNEYGPLEKRIEDAERKKAQAQAAYDSAVGLQQNLAGRRKPLFAFIHLAYFFSKYAGDSIRLESISDNGAGMIDIRGIYTDPEEGLSLKTELNQFAADKNLRIVRDRIEEQRTANGRIVIALEMTVDYQELSK